MEIRLAGCVMRDKIPPKTFSKPFEAVSHRPPDRARLLELVRFLARRAAEADYQALLEAKGKADCRIPKKGKQEP